MPRMSKRAKLLRAYTQLLTYRLAARRGRPLYDINDPQEDDTDFALLARLQQLRQTRYMTTYTDIQTTTLWLL